MIRYLEEQKILKNQNMLFFKNPYYPPKTSDHFDGKRFFNPWNQNLPTFLDVLKWKWASKPVTWPKEIHPSPSVKKDKKSDIEITFIGHSSFLIKIQDTHILIDPIYAQYAGPLKVKGLKRRIPPGIDFKELPKIDIVLVSHSHYDHCDIPFLKKLKKRDDPHFILPLGLDRLIQTKIRSKKIQALDWFENTQLHNCTITLTPAQHWSSRTFWDKNYTLWGGFMIESLNQGIYFVGDSGYDAHLFKKIKSHFKSIDVSLIPIGAYKPRFFMKYAHMNPDEAVKTHLDLDSKQSFAMHHRCFPLTDEGPFEPENDLRYALEKHEINKNSFLVIQEGEIIGI
jgi:L-ascorbate metabolism protein UlaG (beta-lactamase superfamily)